MRIHRLWAAPAMAVVALVIGATPAAADGPPVPDGCTFDQVTGVLTCASSTTTTDTLGPLSTEAVPTSTTFDWVTGAQICHFVFHSSWEAPDTIALSDAAFTVSVTTTTTTQRHGLRGVVFDTSTSTSSTVTGWLAGGVTCQGTR